MYELIIVGAGPMGLFASFYAGMHKIKAFTIETHSSAGGQLSRLYKEKYIYDIPGFRKVRAGEYIDNLLDQYSQYQDQVKIQYNTIIKGFNKKEDHFEVVTSKGTYQTKILLITSGNGTYVPKELEVEGAEGATNLLYHIESLADFNDKEVVVLGGGDSAVDWALELEKNAKRVTLVHRRNEFRAHQSSVDQLKTSKVRVLTPNDVTGLVKDGSVIKAVKVRNSENNQEEIIMLDYLIVNYGMIVSNSVALQLGLENINGSIVVKGNMESSVEGVFGSGNCVTYDGKIKTITCGMGEVSVAINSINQRLHPTKNQALMYSSLMFNKNQ